MGLGVTCWDGGQHPKVERGGRIVSDDGCRRGRAMCRVLCVCLSIEFKEDDIVRIVGLQNEPKYPGYQKADRYAFFQTIPD